MATGQAKNRNIDLSCLIACYGIQSPTDHESKPAPSMRGRTKVRALKASPVRSAGSQFTLEMTRLPAISTLQAPPAQSKPIAICNHGLANHHRTTPTNTAITNKSSSPRSACSGGHLCAIRAQTERQPHPSHKQDSPHPRRESCETWQGCAIFTLQAPPVQSKPIAICNHGLANHQRTTSHKSHGKCVHIGYIGTI